jgi:glycosyltransferase involved in cell wall biosynthesis
MMSSGASSFLVDGAKHFGVLAKTSKQIVPGWRFLITGHESAVPMSISSVVERTGFVDDPLALLHESRAVALLTDYGFGFKTKILEAAACGCWSLVTPLVFDRLPVDVRPYCVVVENKSAEAFATALENTRMPLPEGDLDALLRAQAYAAMDRLMGVKG